MTETEKKIQQITERALFQRINRHLAKNDEMLKKTRGTGKAYSDLGRFYILNFRYNLIVKKDVDLMSYALEAGIVTPEENKVAKKLERQLKQMEKLKKQRDKLTKRK